MLRTLLSSVAFVLVLAVPVSAQSAAQGGAEISLDELRAINPAVGAHYAQISPCVPHMGLHYGAAVDGRPANAPNVVLSVDPVDYRVTAMEVIVPSDMPWQPWFDQPEGEPLEIMPGVTVWTQHVYLVDPSTISPCPSGAGH